MKSNKEILQQIVTELISEEAISIVMYLRGKKRISEFIIAEELELEIHRTRFLLYKLLEHNIVSFIRKKDKIKGWYICYWDLNENIIDHTYNKLQKEKIEKLKERLKREEENNFFMCRNACSRMDFDKSMESHFRCPECGEIMYQQDNERTIEFLKSRIKELENKTERQKVEVASSSP